MSGARVGRLVRVSVGFIIVILPLFAFFSAQTLPTAENGPEVLAAEGDDGTPEVLTTEETQTAVAATQTSFAQTVQAAGTQTAVAATQTSIAGTQTAIAKTQTAVAQPSSTAIYVDTYEPNDTLQTAYTTMANASDLCSITLWPTGDIDYFRFVAKAGSAYEILTSDLDPGIDTFMTLYNTAGDVLDTNDDYEFGNLASRIEFSAFVDGYYYVRIGNRSPGDPANKTYCFEVDEIQGTATPTHEPTGTPVPGADDCEYNGTFEEACLIGPGQTYDFNFVPAIGEGPDNDFFRLWVKAGINYSCETLNLSSVNDTNMILYDQNHNGLGGNDDKAPGDFGSQVSYLATYTGWMYILVGPYAPPEYPLSYLYTYSLQCVENAPTPTPTATPTQATTGGGNGGTGGFPSPPTPTPIVFPTFPPTPTPITFITPSVTPRPVVQIVPLPTNTPVGGVQATTANLNLTVYYDSNGNFEAEITEGVENVGVALYENATNELLAFGTTNEAGTLRFGPLAVSGPIRVSVPFLRYNQVVSGDASISIRIAPWPLP